jgi:hypothetical protein
MDLGPYVWSNGIGVTATEREALRGEHGHSGDESFTSSILILPVHVLSLFFGFFVAFVRSVVNEMALFLGFAGLLAVPVTCILFHVAYPFSRSCGILIPCEGRLRRLLLARQSTPSDNNSIRPAGR